MIVRKFSRMFALAAAFVFAGLSSAGAVHAADLSKSVAAEIPVEVSCEGNADASFSVGLFDPETQEKISEVSVKAGGSGVLVTPRFVDEGDTSFEVRQLVDDVPEMSYDPSVYDVNVHVADVGGELKCQVSAYAKGKENKAVAVRFANQYTAAPEYVQVSDEDVPLSNVQVNPNARDSADVEPKADGLVPKTGLTNHAVYFAVGSLLLVIVGGVVYWKGRK